MPGIQWMRLKLPYETQRSLLQMEDTVRFCCVPDIEVIFIDEPDPHISSVGCRGIGEIGITGITAAIANAVYHATGKRIRELPITPDKLI